eukprot:COSAG02_NODE_68332_length_251_cov_0.309211_1_plen_59_part_01
MTPLSPAVTLLSSHLPQHLDPHTSETSHIARPGPFFRSNLATDGSELAFLKFGGLHTTE